MTRLSVYCAGSLSGLAGDILASYTSIDASVDASLDLELTTGPIFSQALPSNFSKSLRPKGT